MCLLCSLNSTILFPRTALKFERINIFYNNHFESITFDLEIPYEFLVHSRYFIVSVTTVNFLLYFSTWQSWHREIILAFIGGPVSRWNLSWLIFADCVSFPGKMILSWANNGRFLFLVPKCWSLSFVLPRIQKNAGWNTKFRWILKQFPSVNWCVFLYCFYSVVFSPSLLLVHWQVWVSVFCLLWCIIFIYKFFSIFQWCFCCCFAGCFSSLYLSEKLT